MMIAQRSFAGIYDELFNLLHQSPVDIECRGKSMCYELLNVQLKFNPISYGISIYSHPLTRAFPIKFAMAELIWILSGSNTLDFIEKYNKAMRQYSDNGFTLHGAYGYRLGNQISECIWKILDDKHTRQAFAAIYDRDDILSKTKDLPCNTSLQFMIRGDKLILTVNSRSSDFITGLPIDAFHWQVLLTLVYNELKFAYPSLMRGYVIYNLASLHVYSTDKHLIDTYNDVMLKRYSYNMYLHVNETYYSARNRSRSFMSETMSTNKDMNPCVVFNMPQESQEVCETLLQIFKDRKNIISR